MMADVFERFYTVSVPVYEPSEKGYDAPDDDTLLGSVMCDVQPHSGDVASEMYGLSPHLSYKLYCADNDLIRRGRLAEINGLKCRITRADKRKFGIEAAAESVENEG